MIPSYCKITNAENYELPSKRWVKRVTDFGLEPFHSVFLDETVGVADPGGFLPASRDVETYPRIEHRILT